MCDINNDEFQFNYKELTILKSSNHCDFYMKSFFLIIFNFAASSGCEAIIDKRFNFSNFIRYSSNGKHDFDTFRFWNIKDFDVNMFAEFESMYVNLFFINIEVSSSRFVFYHEKKRLVSCQDFVDLKIPRMRNDFSDEIRYIWFFTRITLIKKYGIQAEYLSTCIYKCLIFIN